MWCCGGAVGGGGTRVTAAPRCTEHCRLELLELSARYLPESVRQEQKRTRVSVVGWFRWGDKGQPTWHGAVWGGLGGRAHLLCRQGRGE